MINVDNYSRIQNTPSKMTYPNKCVQIETLIWRELCEMN